MSNRKIDSEELDYQRQEAFDLYYQATTATVMVPVRVRFHDATDTLYGFDPPTHDQVTEAMKTGPDQIDLEKVKDLINQVYRDIGQSISEDKRCFRPVRVVGSPPLYYFIEPIDPKKENQVLIEVRDRLHRMGRLLGMWRNE